PDEPPPHGGPDRQTDGRRRWVGAELKATNPDRQMHLHPIIFVGGRPKAAWRHPDSPAERIADLTYVEELARTAERGRPAQVFVPDGHAAGDVAGGPWWFLEPLTALSAMRRATRHIGLVSTVSSTFYAPFHAARLLASLDHISGGRMGWN